MFYLLSHCTFLFHPFSYCTFILYVLSSFFLISFLIVLLLDVLLCFIIHTLKVIQNKNAGRYDTKQVAKEIELTGEGAVQPCGQRYEEDM